MSYQVRIDYFDADEEKTIEIEHEDKYAGEEHLLCLLADEVTMWATYYRQDGSSWKCIRASLFSPDPTMDYDEYRFDQLMEIIGNKVVVD